MSNERKTITIMMPEIRGFILDAPVSAEANPSTTSQLQFVLENVEQEPHVGIEKTPSEAVKAVPPWELVDPNGKVKAVPLPMDTVLYAKMLWLTQNLGKMSFQKLAIEGTSKHVDELIKEYYKG